LAPDELVRLRPKNQLPSSTDTRPSTCAALANRFTTRSGEGMAQALALSTKLSTRPMFAARRKTGL
jgi:hypothetical protein